MNFYVCASDCHFQQALPFNYFLCMCIYHKLSVHPHLPALLFLSILFVACFHRICYTSITGMVYLSQEPVFFTFVLEDSNNTSTCLEEYTLGLLLLESVKFATKNLWSHVPIILILWYPSLELFVFHVISFSLSGVPWDSNMTSTWLVSKICYLAHREIDIYLFVHKIRFKRCILNYN